jgi:hypothetical protein
MDIEQHVALSAVAIENKVKEQDILFDALSGHVSLYYISDKNIREALVPCKDGPLHHADVGEYIHQIQPMFDKLTYIDVSILQALKLSPIAIKELIVSQQFNEVELYRELAMQMDDSNLWKTERELHDYNDELPTYNMIDLSQICMKKIELEEYFSWSASSTKSIATEKPTNTSLKVIALLMHHLAKSPRYASGKSPNKSQIKKLLLELADELDIDDYGLNKVDERLLAEALKYLETQKN